MPTLSPSRRGRPSPWLLLLFLALALGLYLYESGMLGWIGLLPPSGAPAVVTAQPLSSGPWVQAYFTSPGKTVRQGGLDALVIADIAAAKEQVDIASFDFDLESITQALIEAHRRGVQVRLVLDDENLADEEVQRVTDELTAAGIGIVYDQRKAFMHDKFVLVDRHIVWSGSWNLTENDTYANNNNFLRFDLPQLAENYTSEFEEMYLEHSFGPTSPANTPYPILLLDGSRIETYFSPEDDARAAILKRLRQAREEIVFMAFSFTDDEMGRVLLQKAAEGVRVRGVIESSDAGNEASEYRLLRNAGLDVIRDGNPHRMHHKVFIIDGRVTITGSYNFSANAAKDNDENVLILENADLARAYRQEFDRVYQAGQKE